MSNTIFDQRQDGVFDVVKLKQNLASKPPNSVAMIVVLFKKDLDVANYIPAKGTLNVPPVCYYGLVQYGKIVEFTNVQEVIDAIDNNVATLMDIIILAYVDMLRSQNNQFIEDGIKIVTYKEEDTIRDFILKQLIHKYELASESVSLLPTAVLASMLNARIEE